MNFTRQRTKSNQSIELLMIGKSIFCNWKSFFLALLALSFLSSCLVGSDSESRATRTIGSVEGETVDNSPDTVSPNYGRYFPKNPIVMSEDANLSADADLAEFLQQEPIFITSNQFLVGDCENVQTCYAVYEKPLASLLTANDNRWAFEPETNEFLQVHAFAHINKQLTHFHENYKNVHTFSQYYGGTLSPAQKYQTALPSTLYTASVPGYWAVTYENSSFKNITYNYYAAEDLADGAYFLPTTFSTHMGHIGELPQIKFSQDPSIIYHENGHALTYVLINTRNASTATTTKSDLGYVHYDEGGSINEGLCDFFSYVVNHRTHFAEWGLGRFYGVSRPLTESDPLHAPGISADSEGRLSYPTYLTYEPNDHNLVIEDVHNAGIIVSHYLVALVEDMKSTCSIDTTTAVNYVLYILTETLAQLGDLTAQGYDGGTSNINHSVDHAVEWNKVATPITFRSFFQTFAKFTYGIMNQSQLCNNASYPKDNIEILLDDYGLLLFKTYNEDLNNATTGHSGTHTAVTVSNRQKTVLISKDLLTVVDSEDEAQIYVFDKRSNMLEALSSLSANKGVTISNEIPSDLPYNNGNGKISPGEFLGLSLNLYNNSNSTMAGIQVLANDWDHMKDGEPCNTFSDGFPGTSEGAAEADADPNNPIPGDCNYITRTNGDETDEELGPICFVQITEDDAIKWASQEAKREELNLPKKNCLSDEKDANGEYITKDCFIRATKFADTSWFSKMNPKSTWGKTMVEGSDNTTPEFKFNNIVFFELSPWIPPGTIFNCRFRARFTNCDDCFTDPDHNDDDFLDYEYSGGEPFKIINLQFTVVD